MFSDKQLTLLRLPLDGKRVKSREQNGIKLSYLEGHDLIDTANLAFGFGSWGYEVKEMMQVSEELNHNQNRVIGYRATIALTVYDSFHKHSIKREDIGFGIGISKDYANAHESALKEAVTDGLKRALRSFGNQFGNALYDKSMKNVDFNQNNTQQQLPNNPPPQNPQPQQQNPSSNDPYASLYPLGLGIQEQNGEIIVTGSTYGKQQSIKNLGFRWDASRKTWYKSLQQAA
jgi:DNA repair and recombination protein RAD52